MTCTFPNLRLSIPGVELLLQPHSVVHQPAQPAAGVSRSCQEEENPRQVRKTSVYSLFTPLPQLSLTLPTLPRLPPAGVET